MIEILAGASAILSLGCLGGTAALLARRPKDDSERIAALVAERAAALVSERVAQVERVLREDARSERLETGETLRAFRDAVGSALDKGRSETGAAIEAVAAALRGEQNGSSRALREELVASLARFEDSVTGAMRSQNDSMTVQIDRMRSENGVKLEEMRVVVDEKLQGTLEKRLGESFKQVSDRLEQVHKGLGEMQNLANGVGDLKRVLTNVKTRGTWGEVQLGNLLEQIFRPDQFLVEANCRKGTAERVDYAIRLPGKGPYDSEVLLPIDSKFPVEDYERLRIAAERGDAEAVEVAGKALEVRVRTFAKDISEKYINAPVTTDFAVMFLPTEGLYAEILRRPGLAESMQNDNRVVVAGPSTLGALLNAIQMGFRTMAIEQRSSEVWQVLGAVKTEFGKYGDVLDKVQKKLQEASKTIDDVAVRKRAIDRQLRSVEALDNDVAVETKDKPFALLPSID